MQIRPQLSLDTRRVCITIWLHCVQAPIKKSAKKLHSVSELPIILMHHFNYFQESKASAVIKSNSAKYV